EHSSLYVSKRRFSLFLLASSNLQRLASFMFLRSISQHQLTAVRCVSFIFTAEHSSLYVSKRRFSLFLFQSFCFFYDFFYASDEAECVFWEVIVFSFQNFLKAFYCFFDWYVGSRLSCKLFCNVEVL